MAWMSVVSVGAPDHDGPGAFMRLPFPGLQAQPRFHARQHTPAVYRGSRPQQRRTRRTRTQGRLAACSSAYSGGSSGRRSEPISAQAGRRVRAFRRAGQFWSSQAPLPDPVTSIDANAMADIIQHWTLTHLYNGHGCLASGHPKALSFVIGHELAHIALNHNGAFRSWISKHMRKLGRADEYSADSVAAALVVDKSITLHGLLLLTVGYALLAYVNPERLLKQVHEVASNKYSKKAEKVLSHPLLLNRLQRILPG